ncbi:NAD kinase [hydrothermal vent metagenome]|uniref:NAD kinase n=1 Tax=hydrothermal vent metagenome TaxID=652676 RepID=A0A3B1AW03_9ZZZZ
MSATFQAIGLLARHQDPSVGETILQLGSILRDRGFSILLENKIAAQLDSWELGSATQDEIARNSDLVIVVGGDGTLLHAARSMADHDVPLLGINLGRLGFLTDISPDNMCQALNEILDGKYEEEQRFLLKAEVGQGGGSSTSATAFNDVVIHKWNVARMIEFETYVDGRFVETQRADGLIIATPTGSTAYALSGGGPLLDPALNALVMVPICPHTLSNRPIVVGGDCEIDIVICGRTDPNNVRITCDGDSSLVSANKERIHIRKHDHSIRLIHPAGHDHFNLLRAKLGWSEHRINR